MQRESLRQEGPAVERHVMLFILSSGASFMEDGTHPQLGIDVGMSNKLQPFVDEVHPVNERIM